MRYFLFLLSFGCGALNTARPLEKGEHRVGASFGGVVLTQLGPPVPLPNLVLEGQSGLGTIGGRLIDSNYGINLTPLAFGTIGMHLGSSVLLAPQKEWRPSLSVMERIHFYNNWLDTSKDSSVRTAYFLNQIDLTAAWDIASHLGYLGAANYIDIADPELNFAPFLGFQFNGKGTFFAQLEARYLAVNRKPDIVDVSFLGGEKGALSTTFSVGWNLGGNQ